MKNSKKTALLVVAGLVAVGLLGGGAYAALGGSTKLSTSSDIELQRGLVGHWKLDGNGKDSTPFARNGTVTGTSNVADRKGKASSAKSFNGTSDNIAMSSFDSNVMTSGSYSGSWTLSVWAKIAGQTADDVLLGKAGCNGGIVAGAANSYTFGLWSGGCGGYYYISYAPANPTTTWHLITATYNNGTLKLYGDGQYVGTATLPGTMHAYDNTLRLGSGSSGYYYNGSLDDARVYNRELNAAEAKALFEEYDPGLQAATGESGLVGHWKLDGNAKDSTPNANNGTITGATLTTDRKGRTNSAYSFSSGTTYIDVPGTSLYNSVFTYSAWIYPTASASNTVFATSVQGGPQFRMNPTSNKLCLLKEGITQLVESNTAVPLNQWSHVGVSYDASGNYTYYLNGQSDGGGTSLQTFSFSSFRIGMPSYTAEYFNGKIDDMRAYNRVLTAAEIKAQYESYDSQVTVSDLQKGLLGHWPFNGNAKDNTPQSNNGTPIGATLTTDRKGRANSAYVLTGSSSVVNVGGLSTFANLAATGFTYSIWLMRTGASSYQWPEIMGAGDTHVDYGIRSQAFGDTISFEYGTSPYSGTFTTMSAGTLPTNEWHFYTVTYGGNTLKSYKDGALVTTTNSVTLNPTFPSSGLNFSEGTAGFAGSIDDPRVYNRPLTAAEIQALYAIYN